MLRQNIKYGELVGNHEVNLYLNGKEHHFDFYHRKNNQHSFLIPRTHFSIFEKDLKQFNLSIVFKSEGKFLIFELLNKLYFVKGNFILRLFLKIRFYSNLLI